MCTLVKVIIISPTMKDILRNFDSVIEASNYLDKIFTLFNNNANMLNMMCEGCRISYNNSRYFIYTMALYMIKKPILLNHDRSYWLTSQLGRIKDDMYIEIDGYLRSIKDTCD